MRIMVVDNDATYLGLLAEALQLHGHEVVMAHDGEEAIAKLATEPTDFILSDISMPRMNGMSLHRHVRQDPKLKHLPFAWNSGYRELRNAMDIEDPTIDFGFDKVIEVGDLLFFLDHFSGQL